MPRTFKTGLLGLLIFTLSPGVFAGTELEDWSGSAQIKLAGEDRYQAFFVPELVYEYSKPDLSDLRIADQKREPVPYFIVNGYNIEEQNKTVYHSTMIKTFTKKGNAVFDFRIKPVHKNVDIAGNRLQFELPGSNFLKEVEVYGGYDGNTWEYVTTGQLYRVDDLFKNWIVLNTTEKYTYYRIIIQKNVENIFLENLSLIQENIRGDWAGFQKITQLNYKIKNQSRETVITIQNPQHLKVKRFLLTVGGNFRREYRVLDNLEASKVITAGEIYNLQFQDLSISKTAVDIPGEPCRAPVIRIKVINNDNRPLRIEKIQTEYYLDQIIFENLDNHLYSLYFGNLKAGKPLYDLESYKEHVLKAPIGTVTLDNFQITKPKEAIKISPFLGMIFNGVIAVIALLLIIFLFRKLNSQKHF